MTNGQPWKSPAIATAGKTMLGKEGSRTESRESALRTPGSLLNKIENAMGPRRPLRPLFEIISPTESGRHPPVTGNRGFTPTSRIGTPMWRTDWTGWSKLAPLGSDGYIVPPRDLGIELFSPQRRPSTCGALGREETLCNWSNAGARAVACRGHWTKRPFGCAFVVQIHPKLKPNVVRGPWYGWFTSGFCPGCAFSKIRGTASASPVGP